MRGGAIVQNAFQEYLYESNARVYSGLLNLDFGICILHFRISERNRGIAQAKYFTVIPRKYCRTINICILQEHCSKMTDGFKNVCKVINHVLRLTFGSLPVGGDRCYELMRAAGNFLLPPPEQFTARAELQGIPAEIAALRAQSDV